ncbi:olfactory receptor 6C1-like [Hyla sarda]|uniref:olfactory receptor 6C1-like n=1 Tax=Hyla sarda TaxID=327740 RepID=UPI0024C3EBED|nr:olfactory receptor 6C1-like [Hyla sarda]
MSVQRSVGTEKRNGRANQGLKQQMQQGVFTASKSRSKGNNLQSTGNAFFFLLSLSSIHKDASQYISLTSLIIPKFLFTFVDIRRISFLQCMVQVYIFIALQSAELLILTVMSYDRYVAICNPFHYSYILNKKNCILLVALTWLISLLDPAPIINIMSHFPFLKSRVIDHLFCDLVPLLEMAHGDTSKVETLIVMEGGSIVVFSFVFTGISYILIIKVISKIPSSSGKHKAFSTCSSHLIVITILYLTLFLVYLKQPSKNNSHNTKPVSVLNTVMIQILNPLLYSLRNSEVKEAFHRCLGKANMINRHGGLLSLSLKSRKKRGNITNMKKKPAYLLQKV